MQIDTEKLFEENIDKTLNNDDNNYSCNNEVDFECDFCEEDLLKEVAEDFSYQNMEL